MEADRPRHSPRAGQSIYLVCAEGTAPVPESVAMVQRHLGSSSRRKCVCACPNNHQQNPCLRRVTGMSERREIYERMCYQKFILPRVAALYLLSCWDSFHWLELGLSQTLETQTPEQVQTPLES